MTNPDEWHWDYAFHAEDQLSFPKEVRDDEEEEGEEGEENGEDAA